VKLLVVNADDFGLASGVNEGIIEAHLHGVVTSTSLMVLRPAAAEAATMAATHPELSVGLHFEDDDLDDDHRAERAFLAQLERFRELVGRDPTHVDSHHHVHASHMATFGALVEPLGVPLRHDGRVRYIGGFWGQPELDHVRREFLRELVQAEAGDGWGELGCHPARVSDDLRSRYLRERAVELQTLTEPGLREELETTGVSLVSFHHWSREARRS
jgi:chitin disaccharide deacetylase